MIALFLFVIILILLFGAELVSGWFLRLFFIALGCVSFSIVALLCYGVFHYLGKVAHSS